MSKSSELRDQSLEELHAGLEETRVELFKLRNEKVRNKKLEKPHLVTQLRRKIARTHTIIREKEMERQA